MRVWGWIAEYAGANDLPVSLSVICSACVERISMTGAWITRGSPPAESVHATDELAARVADLQFTLGEGPAVDAAREGRVVEAADLAATASRRRWPAFAPAAEDIGVLAVLAVPLRVGAARIGVFGLYADSVQPLYPGAQTDVAAFADIAIGLVLDRHSQVPQDAVRWRSDVLALSRVEVHQATGIVSVQLGVDVTEALVRLRAYAFAQGRPLIEIAREVVSRRLRFSQDTSCDTS
jgi:GAF domain-containing protein/ANTAR domain-containing protein